MAVLEIEPQTLWRRRTAASDGIGLDRVALHQLLSLPQTKIAHGIGMPVAGTVRVPVEHRHLLHQTLCEIRPSWFSEHLSFNRTLMGTTERFAGFLLPPLQSTETVAIAADNVSCLTDLLVCPVAFETGVNYLKPSPGEMSDGEFFASVAEAADCGILLDLHNLWVNEQNGRQPWREVIQDIPANRIWEIHVAGGSLLDGYCLDSHCNIVPDEVLSALEECIDRWPELGAIVFEILPSFVDRVGLEKIARQLERLAELWRRRRVQQSPPDPLSAKSARTLYCPDAYHRAQRWEQDLVTRIHESTDDPDAGIEIYRRLITDARAAAVSQLLRCTVTLLFLSLGSRRCEDLMKTYIQETEPQVFSEDEAVNFCEFLLSRGVNAGPFLEDVMRFECGILQAARSEGPVTLEFDSDPETIIANLLAGQMPPEMIRLPAPIKVTVRP